MQFHNSIKWNVHHTTTLLHAAHVKSWAATVCACTYTAYAACIKVTTVWNWCSCCKLQTHLAKWPWAIHTHTHTLCSVYYTCTLMLGWCTVYRVGIHNAAKQIPSMNAKLMQFLKQDTQTLRSTHNSQLTRPHPCIAQLGMKGKAYAEQVYLSLPHIHLKAQTDAWVGSRDTP